MIIFVCISFLLSFLHPEEMKNKKPSFPREQVLHCSNLRNRFVAMKSVQSVHNFTEFLMMVKEIMSCPWTRNLTRQVIH
ncbi:hypothetical protein AAFF_G00156380, partial [Aldrovandia affinis]